jgi:dienelactone hydrolase
MGSLTTASVSHKPVRKPAASLTDDRRDDRDGDGRRDLGRRQDALLLHDREGHRAAPHLGGADGRRRSEADHDGTGIETYPAPLASGKMATISASWNMPNSALVCGHARRIRRSSYPTSRPGFPMAAHVEPQLVITQPADKAFEIHNPGVRAEGHQARREAAGDDLRPRRPVRQMLLGYHYRYVYHQFYALNEWLASQGYIVMSINYRAASATADRSATRRDTGAGNSEYQDVVAGGVSAIAADVDTKRIGIYGLSYGGLLTAQALARNSTSSRWASTTPACTSTAARSIRTTVVSVVGHFNIDKWKSPVLIIQGDDDRNVLFAQTVGLVSLLRAHNVEYELLVLPDDVHDSLIYGHGCSS